MNPIYYNYVFHQDSTFPDGIGPTSGPPGGTGGPPGGLTGWLYTPITCPCDTDGDCYSYSDTPYTINGQSTAVECCVDLSTISTSTTTVDGQIEWFKNGIKVYREYFDPTTGPLDGTPFTLTINYTYWDDTGTYITDSGSYFGSVAVEAPIVVSSPPTNYFPVISDDIVSCNYSVSCSSFNLRWTSQDNPPGTAWRYEHRFNLTTDHDSSRCCT